MLIEKKKFAVVAPDPKHKLFIVYMATLNIDSDDEINPSKKAQIAYLKADEAPSKLSNKYADFADVFSPKLAIELPEHMKINDHTIK